MTPSELRAYLKTRGEASLTDLSAHFDADAGLVEDVLAYWQKKGNIQTTSADCGNKSCPQGCGRVAFYRWQGER
jgi:hypothetical protein